MKQYRILIGITLILCIFLISNSYIFFSQAQGNGDPFTVHSEFKLLELAESNGEILNTNSINFSLPSENWNLTNIELNFTGIQSRREIKDIVTDHVLGYYLYKGRTGMGVQIIITEPTEIYAVHIYGAENDPITTTTVFLQINGYDSILNRPNETIIASTQINISTELKWYIQEFSIPVFLNPGNYYLVMNGTNMLPQDNGDYYWATDNDPENPNLHTSEWDKDLNIWINGTTGQPFLYKLDQKIAGKCSPEEINMTAIIDGTQFPISNGPILGNGLLNESVYIVPSYDNITISHSHNSSINLIYNVSYTFNFESQLTSYGSGIVNEESPDVWTLTFLIVRFFDHQSVRFIYPKSWYNFTIYQKSGGIWLNRTLEIKIDENSIFISNNSITNEIEWKLTSNSPNLDFNINIGALEWEPGQFLQFYVATPSRGNLTFYFINSLGIGYDEAIEIKEAVSGNILFSYTIPSNSREGTYTILIYWNNNTDAGVQSQEFEVSIPPIPFTIDPIWIVIGIVIAIGGSIAGIISYRTIKKYRIKILEEKEKLYNKCMDVLNLDYIIVSEKKSGINVYQQKFAQKDIDAAMISGFLQAIHSFGIELIKIEDSSQTIKLEYKDSIIIMTEFVNLRLILIMKESPSSNFLYSLEDLAFDLYKYYGKLIDEFNGDIKPFKSVEKLLKHHLNTSLTYPIRLKKREKLEKIRITPSERGFINAAVSFMKINNRDTFNLASILKDQECSPKDLEIIFKLIEKDIFQVIE
ncbi:MAG: hypothetical protein ACFE9N_03465 [Promethearchaeota archaeon]